MTGLIYGIVGFVLAAAVFCGGFALGWRLREEKLRPPTPEELGQQERQRLINEQNAFRELLNYNTDVAYGIAVSEQKGDE